MRAEVVGGKQLDGFLHTLHRQLVSAGVSEANNHIRHTLTYLPGFFRPTKMWDLIVATDSELCAIVELKAHIGPSFGNNTNNRAEEAIGNAADLWQTYREGAFADSPAPWLGYLLLLEDCDEVRRAVAVREPHFDVFPEFKNASYQRRYELLLRKLVRERLYSAARLLSSNPADAGATTNYHEPATDLSADRFIGGLLRRCTPARGKRPQAALRIRRLTLLVTSESSHGRSDTSGHSGVEFGRPGQFARIGLRNRVQRESHLRDRLARSSDDATYRRHVVDAGRR